MIRVNKPTTIPVKLATDGKNKRRSHSQSYTRNHAVYNSGSKKFSFDSNIYAHSSVKQALINAQHSKCCFCERLIGKDGDVEHFRPKQAYKQIIGQPLQRPGYYWLAYEWDNLYLSCPSCNQRHKQNLFPLAEPAKRATNHHQSINDEQPLFIDPGKDDPERLIGFRSSVSFAIHGSPRGQATIDNLKLNERSLPEARLQRLKLLKRLSEIIQLANRQPANAALNSEALKARMALDEAVLDTAEFAAAARWAIRTNFQYVLD